MKRFMAPISLDQFQDVNYPLPVGRMPLEAPAGAQRVLRVLVQSPYSNGLQLPPELAWTAPALRAAEFFQRTQVKVRHPFTYITVRHGQANTRLDDEWHADGFSMKSTHLPEANYVLVEGAPTEVLAQKFHFPADFDPMVHNVHTFFQRRALAQNVFSLSSGVMYFIDPYVVHRRPPHAKGWRTFLRITFAPLEVNDVHNTPNPRIPTPHYVLDGVQYRNTLLDYDAR